MEEIRLNKTKMNIEITNIDELKKLIIKANSQVEQLEQTLNEISKFKTKFKNLTV